MERFSQLLVVFVVQIILARLLEPSQFGLIAMVAVFVLISNAIVEAGLGAAIIQRQGLQDADLSTIFYTNIGLAGLAALGLWALGPAVASFYGQPQLDSILGVLGLGLIFNAAGVVQRALLQKQLAFRRLFWVTTPANLISGVVGIMMAYQGYGVWALVGQNLTQKIAGTALLWVMGGWRPHAVFERHRLLGILPYSFRLALSGVLDQAFSNIYTLVIGKVYTPAEVGFFQRAREFSLVPLTTLQSVVSSIAFPVLSEIQNDPAKSREVLKRVLQLSSLAAISVMAVLGALAEPLIVVLLGERWLPSAPILQLLCISGMLYPLHAGNLCLLQARGRSDLFLRLEIYKKLLTMLNLVITYRYGLHAMLVGMVTVNFAALILNTRYSDQLIQYGLQRQLKDVWRLFVFGGICYAAGRLTAGVVTTGYMGQFGWGLLACLLAGLAAYYVLPALTRDELQRFFQQYI